LIVYLALLKGVFDESAVASAAPRQPKSYVFIKLPAEHPDNYTVLTG
jgi:hypothetical protein